MKASSVLQLSTMLLLFLCSVLGVSSSAVAQGSYSGTTTVPATGNTTNVDNPTNSDGGQTTMDSLTVVNSDTGDVYTNNVDYTWTYGSSHKHIIITWVEGKRPAKGTHLRISGSTAASGTYTVTITWP